MAIEELCKRPECGSIEYKSQWYWDLNDYDGDKTKLWGEFIKDILALINANFKSFNSTRYMIIGYDESSRRFIEFNLDQDKFNELRKKIKVKIDSFISDASDLNIKINNEIVNTVNIIVIEIQQPVKIHFLRKDIQTKTAVYKENIILYRGNNGDSKRNDDNVGVMPLTHLKKIESNMREFFGSSFTPIISNRNKSIYNTISSYLEKNRTYILSEGFPKKSTDNKKYFELYELKNKLDEDKSYFAYISDKNIKPSIESLFNSINSMAEKLTKIFLLIDKPNKSSPEKRINYIKKICGQTSSIKVNIEFIEDFGRNYLYQEYLEPLAFNYFPNTKNFIESFSEKIDDEHKSIYVTDILKDWFTEENNPLIVLTGAGGVGKTTVVRNFLNTQLKNLQDNKNNYVLFLNSSSLLEQLRSDRISTIYDLYKADISDTDYFTEELFKLSIDNGSFVIILDGLDEIISGASVKFQLQDFLKNIFEDYCFNLAKTKIIITCRDYIWNEAFNLISEDFNIEQVKIQPFNLEQAEKFFESCFKTDTKLQKKSLNIVMKLISQFDEKYYSPFMLDTISNLVKSGNPSEEIEDIFELDDDSTQKLCLIKNNILDYLIFAVCKREVKKINVSLLNQINILCKLSQTNKTINKTEFSFIVKDFIKDADDITISHLLNHAFIERVSDKDIIIRYDFLKDFFLRVTVAQHFSNETSLPLNLLEILVSKVSYLNNFSLDVGKRLLHLDKDTILLFLIQNIEDLNSEIKSSKKSTDYKFYISNLFILYLGILKSKKLLMDANDLNQALLDVYSNKSGRLSKLYLCDIRDIKSNPKLLFDFSDLTIFDCYIDNYYGFTACEFNENTLFETGSISIEYSHSIKSNLKPINISKKIVKLGGTSQVLDFLDSSLKDDFSKKKGDFKKFIKFFLKNGRFMPKKSAEVKGKKGGKIVKTMLANQIIKSNKDSKLNQEEYIINIEIEDDLYKFLDSGVVTPEIKKIINFM